jgi:hypothetical protein
MLALILVILIVLWLLGYLHIVTFIPNIALFSLNGHTVTLWELLIFFVIIWALGILPSPLREIAAVLLLLWILSTLGIIAIAGFSSIIIIAIIVGLVLAVLGIF